VLVSREMKVVVNRGLLQSGTGLVSKFGLVCTCAPTKSQSEFVGKAIRQSGSRALVGQTVTTTIVAVPSLRSKRSMRLAVHAMQVRYCVCSS
jgi:hypothetical protein